ncbi:MAG TPA: hypothetical protein VMB78_07975 [Dissulfurispiraceae bacterium]|nr:hypothetical protein [Dissulfurispiraceae bacterium]
MPIDCPKCDASIEYTSDITRCPSCDTKLLIEIFPAFFRQPASASASLAADEESACFFHPRNKATVSCAMCGRFICSLCDVELSGQHVCPSCIESGLKKRKITNLENRRILYDDIALALAIIPIIFFWPTIITAPASIYLSLRHWKSPTSIIHRTKVRFVVAIFISLLQLAGWGLFISYLVTR